MKTENKHTPGNCYHCGADDGLHQAETNYCPRWGIEESRVGKRQKWDSSTFLNANYQRLCDVAPEMYEALKEISKCKRTESLPVETVIKMMEALTKAEENQ